MSAWMPTPSTSHSRSRQDGGRRCLPLVSHAWSAVAIACMVFTLSGCSLFRGDSEKDGALEDLLVVPDPPEKIGEAALPYGLTYARVQGVGAVKGLNRTGAPALPSEYRDRLIAEMKTHNVADPDGYLESDLTALVITEAIMSPGVKRGDRLDILVTVPSRSEVKSLQGGWLMPSRLQEMRRLDVVRSSNVAVTGTGPVLVRSLHDNSGEEMQRTATILGGGVAQVDRPVGLVIRPQYQHALLSREFAKVINQRFYFFDGSSRRGIATAREDDFIELDVLPRYEENVHRLIAVVRAMNVQPHAGGLRGQLESLDKKLKEPTTAADAALSLEAIGSDSVPLLVEALKTPDDEIRFYAAEALAYLDEAVAIEPLAELARTESAFRYPALKALQGMPQNAAAQALRGLMNDPNNEVRYGAFTALRKRPDSADLVGGQRFGDGYYLHTIPSTADPLVAVGLGHRPEIVMFGSSFPIELTESVISKGGIVMRDDGDGKISLSRFRVGEEDQTTSVPANIPAVCAGLSAMGAGYSDCVDVLSSLKANHALPARFAFDPSPRALRTYYRNEENFIDPSEPPSLAPHDITPPVPKEKTFFEKMSWWSE
ncbi:flagellar basal body P-ring protein [Roseimaritima multifibrata]|uniref:Flagellar basal body P-ring protein n=1 Tax=Roseimaritima multifibrata TaxID=1930274 RepID=A0A517MEK4_9BACT|nr:flagellar basal body P-ring protein FlgI [Roseimaritima multifibrata]QDS93308.1 flagellar basal body P-ring protein [Roseimaritima multifibrata]